MTEKYPGYGLSQSWLQVERNGKILVFGRDSTGTYIAIFNGDFQHMEGRFDTSIAELIGCLIELWKLR